MLANTLRLLLAPTLPQLLASLVRLALLAELCPEPAVRQAARLLHASAVEVHHPHGPAPELPPHAVCPPPAELLAWARALGESIDQLDREAGPLGRVGWAQAAWDLTLLEVRLESADRAALLAPAVPAPRDTLREPCPTDPAPALDTEAA